jgi:hypothetical protein
MTAMGTIALLAPRCFKQNSMALLMPMLALLVSDAIIGFHSTMFFTYLSVFLVSVLSWKYADSEVPTGKAHWLGWAAGSSALFFVITNFGAWLTLDMYSKTFSGLLQSYWNAIPFLGFEFAGTALYLTVALVVRQLWSRETSAALSC